MKSNLGRLEVGAGWCLVTLLAISAPAAAQELAESTASYRIEVRLDSETTELQGTETLTWVNGSTVPVPDLWFHLYQNAFLNDSSTVMRERGGFPGGGLIPISDRIGYTDVHVLRLADGTDLLPTLRWRHPDDDNADDRTVFSVDLPEPVSPGDEVVLEIEFTTRLPRGLGARSEVTDDDYYLVAQWFPKVAVFEDVGDRGASEPAWNAHQFHAAGEFYADYGSYEVHINVPQDYVVGATGTREETSPQEDGTVTYVYRQEDVHDFAWTTWRGFEEVVRTFDPHEDVSREEYEEVGDLLGVDAVSLELEPVEITLLMPPAFAHHTERHITAMKNALKWFGLWYGAYPYETVTVVVPADGQTGSGMEYPTFFTSMEARPLRYWPARDILLPEEVTIHEFGHQFWYGLVGNNEFEEAWLDEGFNSYSTGKVIERAYGSGAGRILGLNIDRLSYARAQYLGGARTGRLVQNAWTYHLGGYGTNSYPKPELVLRTLERYLGEPTFARALRAYHQRWRFRHPRSEDFFAAVEETCRCDLSAFWDQMVHGDTVADYAIASASSRQLRRQRGRYFRDGGWVIETGRGDSEATEAAAAETGGPAALYRSTVVVQRLEDFRWPVDVLLHFEDGSEILEVWDGQGRTHAVRHIGPERLDWAVVDPERKLPLDINWLNNSRVLREAPAPRRRWAMRWMFWMANLLFAASGMG